MRHFDLAQIRRLIPFPRRSAVSAPPPTENLRREVLRLGLPAVAERMLGVLVNLVNTMLVGHLGAAALVAVGLSGTIEMIGSMLFQAVATGTTALVAQAIGAKNRPLAQQVLEQSMLVAIGMGLACLALLGPFTRSTLSILGAEPDVVELGMRYLPYLVGTYPLVSLMAAGTAALRGAGDTRTPMYIMGVMNVLNAILSWVLIRGWGPIAPLGVEGAGIAAGISRTLAGLAVMGVLWSGRARMRLTGLLYRPRPDVLRRIMDVGLPAGAENIIMRLAFLSFTRAIASLGTVAFAAFTVAQRVENITMMPAMGFSVSATTLSGQSVGAGNIPRARASVFRSIEIGVACSLIGTICFTSFPRFMLSLFTTDQAVIAQGILPLQIMALTEPIMTGAFCLSGGLRGAGDTRSTMWVTGMGAWLVRVPITVLAVTVLPWGLPGVQLAMLLDWSVRLALYAWRFRPAAWVQRAQRAAAAVRGAAR